jgi:glycosyltransferase involved in cell wall biosynthesis
VKLVVLLMVKNEAENICDVIDVAQTATKEFVLVDTGSTDGTISAAKEFCEMIGVTLHIYQDEWEGYAHNRCVALGHAYTHGDWVLQLSGDEYLHDGAKLPAMIERLEKAKETALHIRVRSGLHETSSPRLVKSHAGWIWEGQIHEYTRHLDRVQTPASRVMTDAWIEHRESNSERKQARFPKDFETLSFENSAPFQDRRSQFYMGWTLEAMGRYDEAIHAYDLRLFSYGNDEEEWFTRFRRACCMEKCGYAWAEVQDAHLKNYATRPWRAEPLADIARHWLSVENWELVQLFAKMALPIPYPEHESGIVMHDVYSWRLNDLVAESGLKCGGAEAREIGAICAAKVAPMFPGDPRVMMYCAAYKKLGFDVPVVAE